MAAQFSKEDLVEEGMPPKVAEAFAEDDVASAAFFTLSALMQKDKVILEKDKEVLQAVNDTVQAQRLLAEAEKGLLVKDHRLERLNIVTMKLQGRLHARGLVEHVEACLQPEDSKLKPGQGQGQGKSLREVRWEAIMENNPDLQDCIVKNAKWLPKYIPKRFDRMYAILSGFQHLTTPLTGLDEILLYTDPLSQDEVDALECVAKYFSIPCRKVPDPALRLTLTEEMVLSASKADLKSMCSVRELAVSGTKQELIKRLLPSAIKSSSVQSPSTPPAPGSERGV